MHILLATDVDWIVEEVTAALGGPDTRFTVCRDGRVVHQVTQRQEPDLAIFDLQIGNMGGMAVTMDLRNDESVGAAPHIPVLMLLDRADDAFLARRSGAEGWLVKPLDALRLQQAAKALTAGGTWPGKNPNPVVIDEPIAISDEAIEDPAASPEEEAATAG